MTKFTYMEKRVAAKEAAKDYIVNEELTFFDPLWKLGIGWTKEGLFVIDETPDSIIKNLKENGYAVARESDKFLRDTILNHNKYCDRLSKEGKLELLLNLASAYKHKLDHVSLVEHDGTVCFVYIAKEQPDSHIHIEELEDEVVNLGIPVITSKSICQQMIDESRIYRVN